MSKRLPSVRFERAAHEWKLQIYPAATARPRLVLQSTGQGDTRAPACSRISWQAMGGMQQVQCSTFVLCPRPQGVLIPVRQLKHLSSRGIFDVCSKCFLTVLPELQDKHLSSLYRGFISPRYLSIFSSCINSFHMCLYTFSFSKFVHILNLFLYYKTFVLRRQ